MFKVNTNRPAWYLLPKVGLILVFVGVLILGLLFYASGRTYAKPHVLATYQCSVVADKDNSKFAIVHCSDDSNYSAKDGLSEADYNFVQSRFSHNESTPVTKTVSKHAKIRENDVTLQVTP